MKLLVWYTLLLGIGTSALPAQAGKPVKFLFLVGGAYHDYDQLPRTLAANLQAKLKNLVSVDFTITKDLSALRKEELSHYDAVMINVCEQTPLGPESKQEFRTAVSNGLPVIAMHCTFWSFQDWPEFKQILGAFVPGHDHFGPFCLQTARPGSPILQGVQPTFELTDEPYIVNDRDPSMNVLVRTCQHLQDRSGAEPEVWTKMYGKGRIFAITFGHDSRAQSDTNYLTLLANGLLWALDRLN
jgi:type 1 glutamine amidotransferase